MQTRSKRLKTIALNAGITKDTIKHVVEYLKTPRDIGNLRLVCKDYARWVKQKDVQDVWNGWFLEEVDGCGKSNHKHPPYHSREVVVDSLLNGVYLDDFNTSWSPPKRVNSQDMYKIYKQLVNKLEASLKCKCKNLLFDTVTQLGWEHWLPPYGSTFIRCKHECWCLGCLQDLRDKLTEQARNDCVELDSDESGDDIYPVNN